jgi:WhiB family transcriptional regulator, redox-sensing transcriptional regulator
MTGEPIPALSMGSYASHGQSGGRGLHTTLTGWGPFQEWELRAACRSAPQEWFFGDDQEAKNKPRRSRSQTARAKAVCATCPVLAPCREWVLRVRLPYGVAGGLSEADRLLLYTDRPQRAPGNGNVRLRKLDPRICFVCGANFTPSRRNQRCCSAPCSEYWRWRSTRDRRARQRQQQAG